MHRKIFIALFVVLILLGAAGAVVWHVANDERFWEGQVMKYMKGKYPGIEVTQVRIERVNWSLPRDQWKKGPTVEIEGINLNLNIDNKAVFGSIKGMVSGRAQVKGWHPKVTLFVAGFKAEGQGKVKAELLKQLAQYIPQRKQLDDLVRDQAMIVVDNALIGLMLIGDDQLKTTVNMYVPQLNILFQNSTVVLNLDGGIEGLMKAFSTIKQ